MEYVKNPDGTVTAIPTPTILTQEEIRNKLVERASIRANSFLGFEQNKELSQRNFDAWREKFDAETEELTALLDPVPEEPETTSTEETTPQ